MQAEEGGGERGTRNHKNALRSEVKPTCGGGEGECPVKSSVVCIFLYRYIEQDNTRRVHSSGRTSTPSQNTPALSDLVSLENAQDIFSGNVWPQLVDEKELGVSHLEKKEVADLKGEETGGVDQDGSGTSTQLRVGGLRAIF